MSHLNDGVVGDEPEAGADGGVAEGAVCFHVGADLVEVGRVRTAELVVDDEDFAVADADSVGAQFLAFGGDYRALVENFVGRFGEPAPGLRVEYAAAEKAAGLGCL